MCSIKRSLNVLLASLLMSVSLCSFAQDVCSGVNCDNLQTSVCTNGGFELKFLGFEPASPTSSGKATYVYEICSPIKGRCSLDNGRTCKDHDECAQHGAGTCDRTCAVQSFHGLSHFDVIFPELGNSICLAAGTEVTGQCSCSVNASGTCQVGDFGLGDSSCFAPGTTNNKVAKCDETAMGYGDCIKMELHIADEFNSLGKGAAVVVDKASTTCTETCIAGPSCTRCDNGTSGSKCLTRTIGFWGTHPWITNNYDPVTVCGIQVGCDDLGNDTSACSAGNCNSITEALCSAPGLEYPKNQAYVTLIRQLTAAKLNLNATAALGEGATCSDFEHGGKSIQQWIELCEADFCDANKASISSSGCIEALDAFNNSQDTGFDSTPVPFNQPSLDDNGNVAGADPTQCQIAKGTGSDPKLVIGKKTHDNNCKP